MLEILRDNARPEAGPVYGAPGMDWAKLGQISAEHAEKSITMVVKTRDGRPLG